MNALRAHKSVFLQCVIGIVSILIVAPNLANAQQQQKKTSAPAPAKPAAPPPKSAPSAPANTGGATASHGPTTSGPMTTGASRGPTTSGPTTSGASHGPTTSSVTHGPTTGTVAHGPTTSNVSRGPTTGNPGGTGTAVHGPTTSNPHVTTTGHTPVPAKTMGPHVVPANSHIVHATNGSEVRTRPNGKVADVHNAQRGMDIHHGLNGTRRVEVERADHTRIVAERGGRSYVEHPYTYGGREYGHRTYYYQGRVYDRYYGHYYYHGAYVAYYTPAYYYAPAFYGWAYNPWVAPVPYAWGWGGAPWYGYYGFYFTPYPVYASASLWLTDYMISNSLAAAYQAQVDANAAAQAQATADSAALTEETKNLIAAEVQRQIALENAEAQTARSAAPDPASSSIQRLLTDGVQHIFVAGRSLDVVDAQGAECVISEGDAMQLSGPPPPTATAADLVMLSSKGGQECHKGATVSVSFTDLQEMQNHMREIIDQGMGELQTKQGKGGLPALPSSANGPTVKASFIAAAPPADANVATEINQQSQAADQAEKETITQVAQSTETGTVPGGGSAEAAPKPVPAPPPPPTQISTGQSIDEVTAMLGTPKDIVDLGTKKIYVYKDIKVTFKNGKVTDVQ